MKCFYQIITTPTDDTPGTGILIHFDDRRYLFGQLSEGTQRAAVERGVRFAYLSDIFLTGRMEWANNGGLIGTILTQADMRTATEADLGKDGEGAPEGEGEGESEGKKNEPRASPGVPLNVHGGRNLTHTIATARRFVFRKGLPIYMREYGPENLSRSDPVDSGDPFQLPTWSDDNIKVWAMSVSSSGGQSPQQSPRKRCHDEFMEDRMSEDVPDKSSRDQLMRDGVVSNMFRSSWTADALIERRLEDVRMPAKIFIRNPVTKDIDVYDGPVPGGNIPLPDPELKVLVRRPWPGAEIEKLPPTTRSDEAMSYIVRNNDLRGRFDPKKAVELNVEKGPLYGDLANGKSVESIDGKTITPDMVLGPTRIGKGAAIIDLPSAEYVDNLVNRPEWKSPAVTTGLSAFFWILGPGVGEHPGLLEFIARFPDCKHIASGTDYCPNYLALGKVAGSSIRLARLKGDNYSIPVHDNVTLPQPGSDSGVTKEMVLNSPFEHAEPGLTVNMDPTFGLSRAGVSPRLNAAELVHKIPHAVEQRMTTVRRRVQKAPFQKRLAEFRKDLPGADVEVTALGTGSSAPSKYRNVSATLVHVPGQGYYLLDCGEATLGQLKRVYGPEQLRHVLQNLRMIWVSHLHADHHLGTASVIKAWYRENYGATTPAGNIETDMSKILQEKRLFVVSDEMMMLWLEEYAAVEDFGFGKIVPLAATPFKADDGAIRTKLTYRHCRADGTYPGHETLQGAPDTTTLSFNSSPHAEALRAATGLTDLLTTRVTHCRGALALSLVFPSTFKLSYSGDCRPSKAFATIGHGSTILIHEATFHDEMRGSAYAKKHSTTGEALEVARRMQARTVLLTHFSQRYQKTALIDPRGANQPTHEGDTAPVPKLETLDIPDDEEEHASTEHASNDKFTDEINVNNPAATYDLNIPVAVAFDYMRIRVADIPLAQAFEPVLVKLFSILEAQATREAEMMKAEAQKAKAGTGKRTKKKAGQAEQAAEWERQKEKEKTAHEEKKKDVDLFEASESESGWETCEPEDEREGRSKA